MAKISRLNPIYPTASYEHLDDDPSPVSSPSSATPSTRFSPISPSFLEQDPKHLHLCTKASATHRSKVILSFFITPSGYKLLRLEHSPRKWKEKCTTRKYKLKGVKISHVEALKWFSTAFISSEEYDQWFNHPEDASSATRAGIRGFVLAFIAGAFTDVLLPAALKRNFKGILRRIATNTSALSLGVSVGAFALIYRLVSRHTTLFIDYIITSRIHYPADGPNDQIPASISRSLEPTIAARNKSERQETLQLLKTTFALIPQQPRRLMLAMYFVTYAGEPAYAALEHAGYMGWVPSWLSLAVVYPFICSYDTHTFIQHINCCPTALKKLIVAQSSPYLVQHPHFNTGTHGPFPSADDLLKGMVSCIQTGVHHTPALSSELMTQATSGSSLIPESCHGKLHSSSDEYSEQELEMDLSIVQYLGGVDDPGTRKKRLPGWGYDFNLWPHDYSVSNVVRTRSSVPYRSSSFAKYYLDGFIGGLWIMFESHKRQSELTLYFTRFMLESMHGETLLFGLSMAIVMGVFEVMPTLQRKGLIQSTLTKIFVD
ncbi:MAG: hypothetical protein J3Q66DRAFT_429363 [Benniella sp.]|nr:MAG: hypothetical protein J3Q66DRAFT_429363 [Benniella sp.]